MRLTKIIFISLILAALLAPAAIFAAGSPLPFPYWPSARLPLLPCTGSGCQSVCDFIVLLQRITWFGLTLVIVAFAPILITFGGIMIIFARGSTENLKRGKQIITSTVIGIAITLGAFLIINGFFTLLGIVVGSGPVDWSTISCG